MRGVPNHARVRTLTPETSDALRTTINGLSVMSRYLLNTDLPIRHDFVLLGFYQQDDLEHHFGHFRRSAGCNYYISVRDIISTHNIDRAKIILDLDKELEVVDPTTATHQCELCDKALTDADLLMLDDIAACDDIAQNISSTDEKMAMLYAAGYVAHKHPNLSGDGSDISEDLKVFFSELNRGGLDCPSLPFLKLFFIAYCFFTKSTDKFCRTRLTKVLSAFPDMFHISVSPSHHVLQRVSNILFKNYSKRFAQTTDSQRKLASAGPSSR